MSDGATMVTLTGKFTFQINQSGLDFHNEQQRADAVKDFWRTYEEFVEAIADLEFNYLRFEFDANKDLKVEEGEY
jgi:hypothetical protein